MRGPRSMAPCVARDRWHRAWPAIDDDEYTLLLLLCLLLLLLIIIIIMITRDRWHRAWPAARTSLCAGFAARSMAPCVATARDSEVFSDDLHRTNRHKRCRRERHGSSESLGSAVSGVRCPVSSVRAWPAIDGTVRGPRSMAPCVARRSNVAVRGLRRDRSLRAWRDRCF